MRLSSLCALLIGSLFTLPGCSPPEQPHAENEATPLYEIVDLTDEFAEFYRTNSHLPDRAKLAAFKTTFSVHFPGFYDHQRIPWLSEAEYDREILSALEAFPKWREMFESKAARFARDLTPAFESFRRAFPDLKPIGAIYILYSLKEFDGAVRIIGNNSYLIFGIDVMQLVHDFEDETPFFHHELFHVYHGQYFDECDLIWCALWSEGLAVAAAHRLTREATDSQLLLTLPRPIRAAVDANLVEAVCVVRSVFHSSRDVDYANLFGTSELSGNLPPRFAYYLGYLVANDAMRAQSLDDLVKLSVHDVEPIVDSSLQNLAKCPG